MNNMSYTSLCTLALALLTYTQYTYAQLAADDTVVALQALNTARKTVIYTSGFQLNWNSVLQTAAQTYIDSSSSDDTPVYSSTNLINGLPYSISYYNGDAGTFQGAVDYWIQQGSTYNTATGTCTTSCTDYTALIYAYSTQVGCGVSADNNRIVCYYTLPNLYNTLPYTPASSIAAQGNTCQSNSNGYCTNPYIDQGNGELQWTPAINNIRNSTTPTPTVVLQVQWNDGISLYAQSLVEQCITSAPNTIGTYGSTYYSAPVSSSSTINTVVNAWAAEASQYNYATNTYTGTYKSNYTQIVDQFVNNYGCAHKTCNSNDIYLCLYDNAYTGTEQPYSSSTVAEELPTVNSTQAITILNTARDTVNYVAGFDLAWNTDLATAAQQYVTGSNVSTVPVSSSTNLIDGLPYSIAYYSGAAGSFQGAVDTWITEGSTYNETTCTCTTSCPNYLALFYAYSTQVGCGMTVDETTILCYFTLPNLYNILTYTTTQYNTQGTGCEAANADGTCYNPYIDETDGETEWIPAINNQRDAVQPTPTVVVPVQWDDVVSMYAQSLVEQCNNIAIGTIGTYGSTYYSAPVSNSTTINDVITAWAADSSNYVYSTNTYTGTYQSNYTQLVDQLADAVGCAHKTCTFNNIATDTYLCIYDHAYNNAQQPYGSGSVVFTPQPTDSDSTIDSSIDQNAIISIINDYRSEVTPQPSTMNNIVWSTTLANTAQTVLEQCSTTASVPAGTVYYETTVEQIDYPLALEYWYDQNPNYDYVNNKCTTTPYTDYLQLVYNQVSQMGCGFTTCTINKVAQQRYMCTFDTAYSTTSQPYSVTSNTLAALTTQSSDTSSSHGLSAGADAGIAIGVVAGVVLLIGLAYYLYRRHLTKNRVTLNNDRDVYRTGQQLPSPSYNNFRNDDSPL